jgi:glycogen synthase
MRILFLTNFFPPYDTGGEGQSCVQVVEGLKERGHSTYVLTSMHGLGNNLIEEDGISRSLYFEMDLTPWRHSINFFTERKKRERHNLHKLESVLAQFRPDIVFIWGMWNLDRSLAVLSEEKKPGGVVYRFATYWPTLPNQHEIYWRSPARSWKSRIPKMVLTPVALWILSRENHQPALKFEHAVCVSEATRQALVEAGIPVSHARVIHTGIDLEQYGGGNNLSANHLNGNIKILYAGRLAPEKGIETIVAAMGKLVRDSRKRDVHLYIAGAPFNPEYENHLRSLVERSEMNEYVTFLGYLSHEEMQSRMAQFDVMVVPSLWQEPFSRSVLEGMLAGLVVVATPTGGTKEILLDGENGLFFQPGDAQELANKITRLADEPGLRIDLAHSGRETVLRRYSKDKMMDEIEDYLLEVSGS